MDQVDFALSAVARERSGWQRADRPHGLIVHETELLILGLCVAIPTLSVIARLLHIPYPIVLVLGAIPLGYAPGVPHVELDPSSCW